MFVAVAAAGLVMAGVAQAGTTVVDGTVSCDGCPAGRVHVLAYPETDRYNWPWWDVYGFLKLFHPDGQLDRMRPAPLAGLSLERPGRFRLDLPTGQAAHLFALLDVDGDGPIRGATAGDWIGRFPRNPVFDGSNVEIELYPLIWGEGFGRARYRPSQRGGDTGVRFVDATASAGIDFRHCQSGDIGHLPVVVGSGALLDDLDGDGDLDLFAVQGLGSCPGAPSTSRLYINDGHGHFRDVTDGSGVALKATGMGVTAADPDRDGDLDLFVTTLRGGVFLRNDGGARFTDVTAAAGLADDSWAVGATFGDVDGDGRLDLYVANYVAYSAAPPFVPDAEIPSFVPAMLSSPFAFPAVPNRLYWNRTERGPDGGVRFELAADAAGAADPGGKGMASVLADLDRDGDVDLYVTNDCTKDRMFENRGGRLVDVSQRAGVDDLSSGMGIALGDLDGDGGPDIYSPHWMNEPSVLYVNRSAPGSGLGFAERTSGAGLAAAGNGLTGWAPVLLDVELDGDLDLLVSNGHTHPGRDPRALEPQPLQLFLNDGAGRFDDRTCLLGEALPEDQVYRGVATGDVDGDGDEDAYVVVWNGPGRLLENRSERRGHWLTVSLERASGERGAVGARVEVTAGGRTFSREVATGTSYLSHGSLGVELGLGQVERIDRLVVSWPGGVREEFEAPGLDSAVTLVEGQGRKVQG